MKFRLFLQNKFFLDKPCTVEPGVNVAILIFIDFLSGVQAELVSINRICLPKTVYLQRLSIFFPLKIFSTVFFSVLLFILSSHIRRLQMVTFPPKMSDFPLYVCIFIKRQKARTKSAIWEPPHTIEFHKTFI